MSTGLRLLGSTPLFLVSDSSPVGLRLLGCQLLVTHRTGSNSRNILGVSVAGLYQQDQATRFQKADGAGSVTPKRSRLEDYSSLLCRDLLQGRHRCIQNPRCG